METEIIKGSCEHCGFMYEGEIIMQQGGYPLIKCPKCGIRTDNFDNAETVSAMDRVEHNLLTYTKVATFELV